MGFDVFIHMAALQHKDGSAIKFSSKGREWLPKLGLGVWPDRPAPAIWTRDDFEELGPGEKPRTLRNQVFQVNSLKARDEARAAMLEWGGVIQVIAKDNASFLARTREVLLPSIKDPCFNCFPFYVPLMQAQSLTHEDGEKAREWLCGASIYIRESPEDSGLLVIGAEGLHSILKSLGASSEGEAAKFWRVPLPG
ncbi:MAG TPA: hypothetical protein VGS27_29710 [Candidatus Sulfotelmatobacter sp.]|nr:hypothetical protein [Candidatus Sulfotelmatobacter sp.]